MITDISPFRGGILVTSLWTTLSPGHVTQTTRSRDQCLVVDGIVRYCSYPVQFTAMLVMFWLGQNRRALSKSATERLPGNLGPLSGNWSLVTRSDIRGTGQ